MNLRSQWQSLPCLLMLLIAVSLPAGADEARRKPARAKTESHRKAAGLDLSIPRVGDALPDAPAAGAPDFYAAIRRRADPALDVGAADVDDEARYRIEPLFRSDQTLQILDAEVPVSLKLGKWKTSEESKALGFSATVPLQNPN